MGSLKGGGGSCFRAFGRGRGFLWGRRRGRGVNKAQAAKESKQTLAQRSPSAPRGKRAVSLERQSNQTIKQFGRKPLDQLALKQNALSIAAPHCPIQSPSRFACMTHKKKNVYKEFKQSHFKFLRMELTVNEKCLFSFLAVMKRPNSESFVSKGPTFSVMESMIRN